MASKVNYRTITPEIRRDRALESQAREPLRMLRDWAKPVRRNLKRKAGKLYQAGGRWARERLRFLKRSPLCANCGAAANSVDHIVPHKGDEKLFWDQGNWQPLCLDCHRKKTRVERRLPRL